MEIVYGLGERESGDSPTLVWVLFAWCVAKPVAAQLGYFAGACAMRMAEE